MKENTFKMIIMVFDICCLTLCTILNIQIAIQKEQLQVGGYVEEQIQQLEKERRANFVKLENRNSRLTENADKSIESVQNFLDKYNDARQQTEDGKQAYEVLKSAYDKRLYLDTVILELDEENGSHEYVERFLRQIKRVCWKFLDKHGGRMKWVTGSWKRKTGANCYRWESRYGIFMKKVVLPTVIRKECSFRIP